jgi:membrane protein required for colicin V production
MKFFDILILVFIGLMAVRGLLRGIIREIFSVGGILVGIYIGAHYYSYLIYYLQWLKYPLLEKVVAFLFIFLITYIGFSIVGLIIRKTIRTLFLGWLDRFLGCIFGLVEGSFIIGILLYFLHLFPWGEQIIGESSIASWFHSIVNEIIGGFLGSWIQI